MLGLQKQLSFKKHVQDKLKDYGLAFWKIRVVFSKKIACAHIVRHQKAFHATITVSLDLLAYDKKAWGSIICHELMHLIHSPLDCLWDKHPELCKEEITVRWNLKHKRYLLSPNGNVKMTWREYLHEEIAGNMEKTINLIEKGEK